ncbi:MAG: hypothetical protein AAF108_05765 [Planctomycetota bacterium]
MTNRPIRSHPKPRPALSVAAVSVIAWSLSLFGLGTITTATAAQQPEGIFRRDEPRFVLLDDYLHFVLIDRSDVADAKGRELLASGIEPRDFISLVEEVEASRRGRSFLDITARALRRPELEATAGRIYALFEKGRLELARDPEEISRNIDLLSGTLRQRTAGRERLIAAGEYAMPQLLEALLQSQDSRRRAAAQEVVISMERQAVVPLSEALLSLQDPGDQERIALILGDIPYAASGPSLLSTAESTESPDLAATARNAAKSKVGPASSANEARLDLAKRYYLEPEDLTSFPGETHQLLWSFDPAIGLLATPIRTEVFHEAMVMRLIERTLRAGSVDEESLAYWVAANFGREIDQPAGYDNPTYPSSRRDAAYYAVAAGAKTSQRVLEIALEMNDTPLALRTLGVITQTARTDLIQSGSPLVRALSYPDRRVQYESALVIAGAAPESPFVGAERVVPVLASTIRFAGERFAVVLASDEEVYAAVRATLDGAGYTVLPRGETLESIAEPLAETPGIDLVVAITTSQQQRSLIEEVRGDPRLAATPYLGLVEPAAVFTMRNVFSDDNTIRFRDEGVTSPALVNATADLVASAAGGELSESESLGYTLRALDALRDLAVAGSGVLDVEDATRPLISALAASQEPARSRIADVLGLIDRDAAQQALVDEALRGSGNDRVMLLRSAARSGRRFGNRLAPRQAEALVDLALDGGAEDATAAAAVIGSLGLPGAEVRELIITP